MGTASYSSDKPIKGKGEDSFGRASFAKRLARTMLEKGLEDGYVIGLYSQWGDGKTSTLNMIEEELRGKSDVVVLKFNPWLFTDQQTMIASLFDTLAEALDKNLKTKKEKAGDVLKKYSGALSVIPQVKLGDAGKVAGSILSSATLDDLKQRVEEIIAASKKRLIVIIDDVDRLDKDELFQLFKLIKIAVDFKNVIYVIAFDDKVVSDALGQRFLDSPESGQSFIEKIIQIPLHLPMIDRHSLDKYILSGIDDILANSKLNVDQDEVNRFRLIFDEHIAGELRTPRMANRYLNSLKFILPLVGEEINAVDLLVIEAVRTIYPEEYKRLRRMKSALSGEGRRAFMDKEEANKKLKSEIESMSKPNSNLRGIILELFPIANNAFRDYGGSYIDRKELNRLKRAASPDYFDRYFTYGIPPDDVSDMAILDIIQSKNANKAKVAIDQLIKEKSEEAVISKLRAYEDEVAQSEVLIKALVGVSSSVSEPLAYGLADTPLEKLAKMTVTLIGKLSSSKKTALGKWAIVNAKSTDFLSYLIRWIGIMSDAKKQDRIFTEGQKDALMKDAALHISTLTKTKPIYKDGGRVGIYNYHTWAEISGQDVVKKRLKVEIVTYADVCDFLTKYASVWYGSGGARRGEIKGSGYDYMCKVIDPKHLYEIIKKHDPKIANVKEFTEYDNKVNLVGNEADPKFRDTLAKQFAYTYSQRRSLQENKGSSDEAPP